jgi:hypothetical protein
MFVNFLYRTKCAGTRCDFEYCIQYYYYVQSLLSLSLDILKTTLYVLYGDGRVIGRSTNFLAYIEEITNVNTCMFLCVMTYRY